MEKLSQKRLIVKYLEIFAGIWVPAHQLRGRKTVFGFLGHQADRRARELSAAGIIEHRINGKHAEYRLAPVDPEPVDKHQETLLDVGVPVR